MGSFKFIIHNDGKLISRKEVHYSVLTDNIIVSDEVEIMIKLGVTIGNRVIIAVGNYN